MERRGIVTERGNLNHEIEVTNSQLRQLKARIVKLQDWLKKETENTEPPTLADYIQEILSRKAQAGKSQYSQSLYNLKNAANMLNFLTRHKVMDMAGLDDCFGGMIGRQQYFTTGTTETATRTDAGYGEIIKFRTEQWGGNPRPVVRYSSGF